MNNELPKPIDLVMPVPNMPTTQQEISHGVFRTFLYTAGVSADTIQMRVRYDDERLVMVFVQGKAAIELSEKMMIWLWNHFPSADVTDAKPLAELWYQYLQGDARHVKAGKDIHSMAIGALSRETDEGRLWLAWLGTSGLRLIDYKRNPIEIETGLFPGEGWTAEGGVTPMQARPHAHLISIGRVDRLLIFSSSLRSYIDDLPYVGRAALQRIAESASAERGVALLFDLHPHAMVAIPDQIVLRYRWDSPYEATLRWNKPKNTTGYRVEQASTPAFIDAEVLAEMMDARQLLYKVQPPANKEVYYRVIPLNHNLAGKPSIPVIVTPVSLVSPIMESVNWTANGRMLARWSLVPQADRYELEVSPEFDFDSPQTEIIYSGENLFFEFDVTYMGGWYCRVRCLNPIFAPNDASQWSPAIQAPRRLQTPQFETVTPEKVSWYPVVGAAMYEVRQVISKTQFKPLASIASSSFVPPKENAGLYEVRALRSDADEKTASLWSEGVAVGAWLALEDEGSTDTIDTEEVRIPNKARRTSGTSIDSDTHEMYIDRHNKGLSWQVITAIASIVLLLGLIVGALGEQRLGIFSDPTVTAIPQNVINATATQSAADAAAATQVAGERDQYSALSEEQSGTIAERDNAIATLNAQYTSAQTEQEALSTQVIDLRNQMDSAYQANFALGTQIVELQATATLSQSMNVELIATLTELEAQQTTKTNQITELKETLTQTESDLDKASDLLNSLQATATYQATFVPTPTPTPAPIFGRR